MLGPTIIRREHKKAKREIESLVVEAHGRGLDFPEGHDYELYCRLSIIKDVLEWVHPSLIRPNSRYNSRIEQLMADCRYYGLGPVDKEMLTRRFEAPD